VEAVFRALADPTRRALLDALFEQDGQTLVVAAAAGLHAAEVLGQRVPMAYSTSGGVFRSGKQCLPLGCVSNCTTTAQRYCAYPYPHPISNLRWQQ